mgnify:CR=1 FL=1
MSKEQIMGIVRHVLTFVGGIFVAKGLATDAFMIELVGGGMTLIGGVWSIIDKVKSNKEG